MTPEKLFPGARDWVKGQQPGTWTVEIAGLHCSFARVRFGAIVSTTAARMRLVRISTSKC